MTTSHQDPRSPQTAAMVLLTPADADNNSTIDDFSELVQFGSDGRPRTWALLRHRPNGDSYAFAAGANAPPWNSDGIPAALASGEAPGHNLNLDLLHAARARKLGSWLRDRARDQKLRQACSVSGKAH